MRKPFAFVSLLVLANVVLVACAATAVTGAPADETTSPETSPMNTEEIIRHPISVRRTYFASAQISEPETLDPALSYESAGMEIIQNVYETLIFYDGERADKFVPQLAEAWEISEDGTTYTFYIRPGVMFHDGAELTASDVAYSFQRGLLFGGYSGPQWLLAEPFLGIGIDDVTGLLPDYSCRERECLFDLPPGDLQSACEKITNAIVADDETGTVTMTLAQPWAPFMATIAQTWGSVMDRDWAIENGAWDNDCATWQNYYVEPSETDPLTVIMNGTGPYKLDHWTPGEKIELVRNDYYWDEPAKLERVVIIFVDNWDTRFAMLQAGDADDADVPIENRAQLDERVGTIRVFNLETGTYDEEVTVCDYEPSAQGVEKFIPCAAGEEGTGGQFRLYIGRPSDASNDLFMTFQIAEGSNYVGSGQLDGNGIPLDFFSDVHIRRAFAYCFNWDTYINEVFDGEAVQQPVLARQDMPGYQSNVPVYSYDPAKCEEEFKASDLDHDGIAAGDDPKGDVWTTGFRFQALYNHGNSPGQIISEIFAANITAVNDTFVVETVGLPWPTFLRTLRASEAAYFVSDWLEDIHDPHNWYQPYMGGMYADRQKLPANLMRKFQIILNRGLAETDPAKRQVIYEEANKLYFEQVPTILLATATSHFFEQRWVHGRVLNPMFPGHYYYTMYTD